MNTSKQFPLRKNPALYEINTAAWLFELSKSQGRRITLRDVPGEEWDRLQKLGIEMVWLMGVWKRSPTGRKIALHEPELRKAYDEALPGWSAEDVIGSSYSISGFEPDSAAGNWEALDIARSEMHRRGISLVLDYIPNHTGIDHPWLKEHPEYYVRGSEEDYLENKWSYVKVRNKDKTLVIANGKDPYFPAWTDTAQLNYFNPGLRSAMIRELEKIAGHCDGVRCDMAMLVLYEVFTKTWGWANKAQAYQPPAKEFWTQAIEHAPGLIWIAEAYWDTGPALLKLGFDYVYDKKLYDLLRWSLPGDVRSYLQTAYSTQQRALRFLENHDEPRSMAVFGKDRLPPAATILSTLPGLRLYHHGQFEGKRIRLPLQLRQAAAEPPDSETRIFYEKLLALTGDDIFHQGVWELRELSPVNDDTSRNLIAYTWQLGDKIKLVVVNLTSNWSQGLVSLKDTVIREDRDYTLTDELNGKTYLRNGEALRQPGLHIILEGYQSHVFSFMAM